MQNPFTQDPKLRGFLLIPFSVLVMGLFTPLMVFWSQPHIIQSLLQIIRDSSISTPHSTLPYFLVTVLAVGLFFYAFRVFILVLFYRRSRHLPNQFILFLMLQLLAALLISKYAINMPEMGQTQASGLTDNFISSIISAAIFIPYFLKSKRVKATFIN